MRDAHHLQRDHRVQPQFRHVTVGAGDQHRLGGRCSEASPARRAHHCTLILPIWGSATELARKDAKFHWEVTFDDGCGDACGNGHVDPTEECDDGNRIGGDGCSATCARENTPPVAVCIDVTVTADRTCLGSAAIDNGSFDSDGNLLGCIQAPSGPFPLGSTSTLLTCTDALGSTGSCSGTVTVIDRTPPHFKAVPHAITTCSEHPRLGNVKAKDACGEVMISNDAPGTFACGTTIVTWAAMDSGGNVSNAQQKVKRLCGHSCEHNGSDRDDHPGHGHDGHDDNGERP
jgi:cysteine-rich repeat protein